VSGASRARRPSGANGERSLLLAAPFGAAFVAALRQRLPVAGPVPLPLEASLPELPASARAAVAACVTLGGTAFTARAMDALPRLRWIGCYGSGYEGVDLDAARARDIAVTHSPGANAASVADLAMGLLIATVRGMPAGRRRLDEGTWHGNAADERSDPPWGLTGRNLGIYGMGEIGLRIARRAEAFDMTVGYHSRRRREDVALAYFPTLLELARWADVLVVAVRAAGANRHAVDARVLDALGPAGHVVNIARGFVIDEAALIAALERGAIAGAGLDVFEHEPDVPPALLALPNVALTPHVGGATRQARAAMEAMVLANLDAFVAGEAMPGLVRRGWGIPRP
jgi:lactate dehydrogenase-like 2-hydroxyacid dehydrogenase